MTDMNEIEIEYAVLRVRQAKLLISMLKSEQSIARSAKNPDLAKHYQEIIEEEMMAEAKTINQLNQSQLQRVYTELAERTYVAVIV